MKKPTESLERFKSQGIFHQAAVPKNLHFAEMEWRAGSRTLDRRGGIK